MLQKSISENAASTHGKKKSQKRTVRNSLNLTKIVYENSIASIIVLKHKCFFSKIKNKARIPTLNTSTQYCDGGLFNVIRQEKEIQIEKE